MLNDYQEQLVLHPDISFVGSGPVSGLPATFNTFVVKSTWTRFALRDDAFAGLRSGASLAALQLSDPNLVWVWPWDIVSFLQSIPNGFLSVLVSVPGFVYEFFSRADKPDFSQDAARGIARNDSETWKRFFGALGSDDEFKRLRPELAYWCRIFGGLEAPPAQAKAIPAAALMIDDPVLERIKVVGQREALLVVFGALLVTLVLVGAIIVIAATMALEFPPAAPLIAIFAAVLIGLVVIGFVIAVIVGVLWLIKEGALIFGGTQLSASTVHLPALRAGDTVT